MVTSAPIRWNSGTNEGTAQEVPTVGSAGTGDDGGTNVTPSAGGASDVDVKVADVETGQEERAWSVGGGGHGGGARSGGDVVQVLKTTTAARQAGMRIR